MTRIFRSSLRSRLLLLVLLALLPALRPHPGDGLGAATAGRHGRPGKRPARSPGSPPRTRNGSSRARAPCSSGIAQVPAVPPPGKHPRLRHPPHRPAPALSDVRESEQATAGRGSHLSAAAAAGRGQRGGPALFPSGARHPRRRGVGLCASSPSPAPRPHPGLARARAHRRGARGALRQRGPGRDSPLAERARLPLELRLRGHRRRRHRARRSSGVGALGGAAHARAEVAQAIRAQQSEAKITVDGARRQHAAVRASPGGWSCRPPIGSTSPSESRARRPSPKPTARLVRNLLSLGLVGAVALGVAAIVGHCSSSGACARWCAPPSWCGPATCPRGRTWTATTRSR